MNGEHTTNVIACVMVVSNHAIDHVGTSPRNINATGYLRLLGLVIPYNVSIETGFLERPNISLFKGGLYISDNRMSYNKAVTKCASHGYELVDGDTFAKKYHIIRPQNEYYWVTASNQTCYVRYVSRNSDIQISKTRNCRFRALVLCIGTGTTTLNLVIGLNIKF